MQQSSSLNSSLPKLSSSLSSSSENKDVKQAVNDEIRRLFPCPAASSAPKHPISPLACKNINLNGAYSLDPAALAVIKNVGVRTKTDFGRFLHEKLRPHGLFLDRYPAVNDLQFALEESFGELLKQNQTADQLLAQTKVNAFAFTICALKTAMSKIGIWANVQNPSLLEQNSVSKISWENLQRQVESLDIAKYALEHLKIALKLENVKSADLRNRKIKPFKDIFNCIAYLQILFESPDQLKLLTKKSSSIVDPNLPREAFKELPRVIQATFSHVLRDLSPPFQQVAIARLQMSSDNSRQKEFVKAWNKKRKEMEELSGEFERLLSQNSAHMELAHFSVKFESKNLDVLKRNVGHDTSTAISYNYTDSGDFFQYLSCIAYTLPSIGKINNLLTLLCRVKLMECPDFQIRAVDRVLDVLRDTLELTAAMESLEEICRIPSLGSPVPVSEQQTILNELLHENLWPHLKRILTKWKELHAIEEAIKALECYKTADYIDPRQFNNLVRMIDNHILNDLRLFTNAFDHSMSIAINALYEEILTIDPDRSPEELNHLESFIVQCLDLYIYGACCILSPCMALDISFGEYILCLDDEEKEFIKNMRSISTPDVCPKPDQAKPKRRRKKNKKGAVALGPSSIIQPNPLSGQASMSLPVPEKPAVVSISSLSSTGITATLSSSAAVSAEIQSISASSSAVAAAAAAAAHALSITAQAEQALPDDLSGAGDPEKDPADMGDTDFEADPALLRADKAATGIDRSFIQNQDRMEEKDELEEFLQSNDRSLSSKHLKLRNFLPLLKKYGWIQTRCKGSHMIFTKPEDKTGHISVPNHSQLDLGLALKLRKQIMSSRG